MSASATVFSASLDPHTLKIVFRPIGEAVVQEDGKTLAVHFPQSITLGPDDRIVIRKG